MVRKSQPSALGRADGACRGSAVGITTQGLCLEGKPVERRQGRAGLAGSLGLTVKICLEGW